MAVTAVLVPAPQHTLCPMTTFALVHGAGETAATWRDVQAALSIPSVAVDLLGRGSHPADLATLTLEKAVDCAARDFEASTSGDLIVVAHSIGGALSPGLIARLGTRVVHLVHVVAVAAPEGDVPLEVVSDQFVDLLTKDAIALRAAVSGSSFASSVDERLPDGLAPMTDRPTLSRVDSTAFGLVPTTWRGVRASLPRTYVQTMRDGLYPQDAQVRLAAALRATAVLELDSGHNPSFSAPEALASLLNSIALAHSAADGLDEPT
jgi:pimeloyl-ACP methyl ester carboxylesterase